MCFDLSHRLTACISSSFGVSSQKKLQIHYMPDKHDSFLYKYVYSKIKMFEKKHYKNAF